MARKRKDKILSLDPRAAQEVLAALVVYLEAVERLLHESATLPESTKRTASLTLEEIDYLVNLYRMTK